MEAFDVITAAEGVARNHLQREGVAAYRRWQQARAQSRQLDQQARAAYAAQRRARDAWAAAFTREQEAEEEWRRLRALSNPYLACDQVSTTGMDA